MIRLGPNARILGLRPEMALAQTVLLGILIKHGVTMILSHAIDGSHSRASLHYTGCAADYVWGSSLESTVKRQIVKELQESLGLMDFDVLLEDAGTANEHVHIEYQPKTAY